MNTRFGEFGGQYIPEILMSEINHVAEAYEKYKNDSAFKAELKNCMKTTRAVRPCCMKRRG